MSDPEVPQPEQPHDVDDVVGSAKAGLDAAAAAGADVPVAADSVAAVSSDVDPAASADVDSAPVVDGPAADAPAIDADLAAFEAAERDFPGTFTAPAAATASDETRPTAFAGEPAELDDKTAVYTAPVVNEPMTSPMADAAYGSAQNDLETTVVPSEPVVVAPVAQPQPIFVQAPEPPRDRGNRGTAGAIGLLATISFAVLYLGATLGLGALAGTVTTENIGEAALAPLTTWGFWTPVVVFFLGFWLLGSIINRGRWGLWVVFGIIVGAISYGGHILGQLFEAPFWAVSASAGAEIVSGQLLAPLAIVAFVLGRELTIWFGAWVARSGARKTELNNEAQLEYERTLEAGPRLSR